MPKEPQAVNAEELYKQLTENFLDTILFDTSLLRRLNIVGSIGSPLEWDKTYTYAGYEAAVNEQYKRFVCFYDEEGNEFGPAHKAASKCEYNAHYLIGGSNEFLRKYPMLDSSFDIDKYLSETDPSTFPDFDRVTKELEQVIEREKLDYPYGPTDEIIEGLYLGGIQSTRPSELNRLGITCAIRVTIDLSVISRDIVSREYRIYDSESAFIGKVVDDALPKIHEALTNKQKVLVHCYAGASRSVTVVLAYLIKYKQLSLKEAWHLTFVVC